MQLQQAMQQQQLQRGGGAQQLQQYHQHGSNNARVADAEGGAGGDPAANILPAQGVVSPAMNGRTQQRAHRWSPRLRTGHCKQVKASNNGQGDEQTAGISHKRIQETSAPSSSPSPATEKPGFLTRLLRTGRGAEKRSHSFSTQQHDGGPGQLLQRETAVMIASRGRSLTPPASVPTTFSRACSNAATPSSQGRSGPRVSPAGVPRQTPRHWLHHHRGKQQQEQQSWQPQPQQQQQQDPGSQAAISGTRPHIIQGHSCCPRNASPFTATCPVPLTGNRQRAERPPGNIATTFPLPAEVPCMAPRVLSAQRGIPACQHGFVRPGQCSSAVNRHMCHFPHQQHHRQVFLTAAAAEAGRVVGLQGGSLSNGSRLTRRLIPSYVCENVTSGAVPSHIHYTKPASFVSARNPFSLCSPMVGCLPAPSIFADIAGSEGSTAASAFQPTQVAVQPPPPRAAVAEVVSSTGATATSGLTWQVPGGPGKAVVDPKAFNTFNVNCFFTQLYLLDSAKRLELIAARISHSMRRRAFSYWVLKHRYSIAKQIWDRKVSKEIEHLRRQRNNIERNQQNYAAETARKRAEAEAGTLDKSAELLIVQEQQREALAQQQAAADEQIDRIQRYKTRRAAVLGSLLLEHGLKRLLYEYQSFSMFALRSNLLTDNDILQHAIRLLPKFVPPSWKKLDPSRQAELLRSEYAHLVEPATIHLTNLREMYRLHRLDLEARSRQLGCYYRRFFAWTESFTILDCVQRSQKRRLLSDAYTMLRYYTWTARAIEGESLACNATIARLRGAREQRWSAPHNSNNGNPLLFSSSHHPRRRRINNMCSGCGCISASCCCCSRCNITTSLPPFRQRGCGPYPSGTGGEEEVDAASGTATDAALDTQSDTAGQQQGNHVLRVRKASSAVVGRDEMSGIFFPRCGDGSPVLLHRNVKESAGRHVNASSVKQSSRTAWIDPAGYAGEGSRRGSPREKCSYCNGSSSAGGVQVSSSSCCCCGQSQQDDAAAAALACTSNAALPSRGALFSSEISLSPTTTAVPRACVSRSSPETADQDAAAVVTVAGTTAAIHRSCGSVGEGGCSTPHTLFGRHGSLSRCLSPACSARERHSPGPCLAHDSSGAQQICNAAEAGEEQQQQYRQQMPEIHRSCFVEATTRLQQTHRLRHRIISSPTTGSQACCFSTKGPPTYAGVREQAFSWKQRPGQATTTTPRQYQQENQQLVARGENREGFMDSQGGTPSHVMMAHGGSGGADEYAASGGLVPGIDDGNDAEETAHRRRRFSFSSSDNLLADISSSALAVAGTEGKAAAAETNSPALPQEAERNAALILGVEPQLRTHTNMRAVPVAPVTITFKHEKRSIWDDPPQPGELPEIEKIHVIGRNWVNTQ